MNVLKKLSFLLERQQKKGLILIFILMWFGVFLESFSIALILPLLTAVTQPNAIDIYPIVSEVSSFVGITTQKQLITGSLALIIIAYFAKALFLVYSGWIQSKFTAALKVDISQRLFTIYMHQPYAFHLQRNSAQLIRNVDDDMDELVSSFAAVLSLLSELLIILGIGVLLFIVEPIGLISIISTILLFGSLFYLLTKGRTLELGKQRQYHNIQVLQHLQQGIGGFKAVTLLGREKNFIQQYLHHIKASAQVGIVYGVLMSLPRHIFELLAVAILSLFIFVLLFIVNKEVDAIIPSIGIFVLAVFLPMIENMTNMMQ